MENLKILFVDNNPRFAAVTVKMFLSSHQVTVVPSMEGAREFLRAEAFDVLLMDYDLEDGKGDRLVDEIKGRPNRPIIIAVSAHGPGNQALLEAGADAVCGKMEFKNIEEVMARAQEERAQDKPKEKSHSNQPAMTHKQMGAAAIILNAAGQVLLVQHSYGPMNWELPGGAAEADESIVETVVREVREEVGWRVEALRMVGVYYDAETDFHHFTFECRALQETPFHLNGEALQCGFWSIDALPRPLSDFTLRRIRDAAVRSSPTLPVSVGPRRWLE